MEMMNANNIPTLLRYVLTLQLFLGGQARLTSTITPSLHRKAMAKAPGTQRHLAFIPVRDPVRHTNFIGALMCTSGALLCSKTTRLGGALLAVSLTLAGVWTQWNMGIPWWLPATNTVVAGIIIGAELKGRG